MPVVPVVLQSLLYAPVTADPGPAFPSYDVNAAFMSFQPHESGIHVVWSGAGEARGKKVRFWYAPRRERVVTRQRVHNGPGSGYITDPAVARMVS